ncbi:MAG: nucleotide pyrophosphohydrolase [Alphaproteobacteria bacterium]|nr:nucleotide pyrophosphohydrolase [Alphaproteobacteria bacterium]
MSEKLTPSLDNLTARLIAFRDARDWRQFHSLKNLIASLNLEAAEVLELTQWKTDEQFEAEVATDKGKARLAEECADVLLYLLLISERAGIDLADAARSKIDQNEAKYPIEKSKGSATKYTDL